MNSTVDPGQHIGLIWHCIGQMRIAKPEDREEAFSVGLVAITEASQTYDPAKGVLASWLANNIKWAIKNFRRKEHVVAQLNVSLTSNKDILSDRTLLYEMLEKMHEVLTENEYQVIMLGAVGFSGQEIAKTLKMTPVQVSRAKKKARSKLQDFR